MREEERNTKINSRSWKKIEKLEKENRNLRAGVEVKESTPATTEKREPKVKPKFGQFEEAHKGSTKSFWIAVTEEDPQKQMETSCGETTIN